MNVKERDIQHETFFICIGETVLEEDELRDTRLLQCKCMFFTYRDIGFIFYLKIRSSIFKGVQVG